MVNTGKEVSAGSRSANLAEHAMVGALLTLREPADTSLPVFTMLLRYSSGLGGEADMQMLAFNYFGTGGLGQIAVALMEPHSTGRVVLASDDPTVDPEVQFNLLSDDRDMTRMIRGVGELDRLVRHPAVEAIAEAVTIGDGAMPSEDE